MANICIAPSEIQPWHYEAALHGEADRAFISHLAHCAYCREQLDELRREQHLLQRLFQRADCPTPDELCAYSWQLLDPTRREAIAVHLSTCSLCAAEQAQFLGPLSVSTKVNPADDDLNLFNQLRRRLRVWVARLLPQDPSPVMARRGLSQPDAPVTQIYTIEETGWEITLTIATTAMTHLVSGQLLGPAPEAMTDAKLSAISSAGQVVLAKIDETGWFELNLAAGDYALWLELGTELTPDPIRLVIDPIKLGA